MDFVDQFTLIIVNDGSNKSLSEGITDIKKTIPESHYIDYHTNMGKGHALRKGVERCHSDLIMYTDYDFPYTYGSMISMVKILQSDKVDAVVGKRDQSYYNHISKRRQRISHYLRNANRLLFRLPTDDTQCGLKVFRQNQKELFLSTKTNRYLIDVEFLKLMSKNKIKVGVQLVKLRENVKLSKISNLYLVKEFFNYLKIMLT